MLDVNLIVSVNIHGDLLFYHFISNLQQCIFKCIHLVDAFIQSELDHFMCE